MNNKRVPRVRALAAAMAFAFATSAGATTITVTSNLDNGAGTLRAALNTIVADTSCLGAPYIINFNIATPPTGPITIPVGALTTGAALPAITQFLCETIIDGYTQPGSSPNTLTSLAGGSNAVIRIVLSGTSAPGALAGISLSGQNSLVTGLSVVNFVNTGILMTGSNSSVRGNFVGVQPNGTAGPNGKGIDGNFSALQVGGTLPGERNVVSGNTNGGIQLGFNGIAQGNLVGVAPNGSTPMGNGAFGISANFDGGAISGNRIAFNQKGIVSTSNFNAVFSGNEIFQNSLIGIDLGNDGPTPNDTGDGDFGPNGLQNSPVITGVTYSGGNTNISATLNTNALSGPYSIAIYGNDDALGQGKFVTGCSVGGITTDSLGNNVSPISLSCTGTIANPTAIATGPQGSSEFSAQFLTPDMSPSTTTVAFGTVPVGQSSAVQPLTITNSGLGTLFVDSMARSLTDYVDTTGGPPPNASHWCGIGSDNAGNPLTGPTVAQIGPGGSCTMNLLFAPQDSGPRNATLTIVDADSPNGNLVINLTGAGSVTPPTQTWTFSPTSVVQGSAPSPTLTLTIANPSGGPFTSTSFGGTLPTGLVVDTPNGVVNPTTPCGGGLTAAAGGFSWTIAGLSVPASGSCSFSMKVSTAATPGVYSVSSAPIGGNVLAASVTSAPSNTATLTVTAPAAPSVQLTPPSLAFGSVTIGSPSPPQTITLANVGTAPLLLTSLSVTPGDFAQVNTCPIGAPGLSPAASCTIDVTFTPTLAGARFADVTIASNATPATNIVALTGTGSVTPPTQTWAFSPASVVQGSAPSPALTLTIANPNGAPFTSTAFGGSLPAGLVVDTPNGVVNPTTPCGGGLTAAAGGASWSISALSVPTSGSCAFTMKVSTAAAPGIYGVSSGPIPGNVLAVPVTSAASNTANLTVTAAATPGVQLTPPSLAFGNVTVGSPSTPQTITLANIGTAPLLLSSVSVTPGDFAQVNTCPIGAPGLSPAASCTIDVTFTPTLVGSRFADITIASNATPPTNIVALAGNGVAPPSPIASLSTNALTFPTQTVGTTSNAQVVTLTNAGTAPLLISSIVSSGDFAQTNNCPASLAPAAACQISVTFTPIIPGTRTGLVEVFNNAPGSPQAVLLGGTATAPPVPTPTAPTSVSFPSTQVGTVSAPITVTIGNSGSGVLVIAVAEIVGSGFTIVSNTCTGASIALAGTCEVKVSFAPGAAGSIVATLRILSNSPSGPVLVGLVGSGTAAPIGTLSPAPASLDFGTQVVGTTTAAQPVVITNTGIASVSVASVTVSGDYGQTNNCSVLADGASCTVDVTFTPAATGARPGVLSVASNASNSPLSVNLSGTGSPVPSPVIELSASSLSFGNRLAGVTPAAQSVTLRNTGGAPLTLGQFAIVGEFVLSNACPAVVSPGGSCRFDIAFRPTIPGPRAGRLSVFSDATNGTQFVDLAGTGCRFTFLNRTQALVCQ